MKNLLFIVSIFFVSNSFGQSLGDSSSEVKYRRSSLHRILIDSDNFPMKDTVITAYYEAPFPDKYNDHSIAQKAISLIDYSLSDDERLELGLKEKGKYSLPDSIKIKDKEIRFVIEKYLQENKTANKLVAKWFNRKDDGSFDIDLLAERGQYNASEIDFDLAKASHRGMQMLSDAGEELIKNTFVVVSKMNYVSNEWVASAIYEATIETARESGTGELGMILVEKVAKGIYNKTREGYSVNTTGYLYQLKWNDSIATVFYNDLWVDKNNIDSTRIKKFDNSNLFKLEFVGEEKARTLVTFSLKKGEWNRSEEEVIKRATIRNIDRNYVKLQKEYDVFKTKTPLLTGGDNITAKIGMKEGVEPGDKFEVLEMILDPETGKTDYKVKGVIKAVKKKIWDNRYYEEGSESNRENPEITATSFKGGKKYYAGMLIRQVK